jgi:hypothetical protein
MKRISLPDRLLVAGVFAFILVFGVMTLIAGGGKLIDAAMDGAQRNGGGFFDKVKAGAGALENEYNLVFFRKFDFVALNGAVRTLMGKQMFPGTDGDLNVLKLNDGMLAQLKTRLDVEACEKPLRDIADYLNERGIDLIFTYVHTKVIKPDTQLPLGANDRSNAIADQFMALLDRMGIRRIDTRKALLATGMPANELYFKTDTHWTIPAAFAAFSELAKALNDTGKFSIGESLTDIGNYEVIKHEGRFLGSDGRRVGAAFSGLDDFTVIIPAFNTSISERSVTGDGAWEERTGTCLDAVMHLERLEPDEGAAYSSVCYESYGYNRSEIYFVNEDAEKGRVLFVKNSAGNPVMDFTVLGVREVCGLDRRVLSRAAIAEVIDEYEPGAVVIIYNFDYIKPDRLDFFNINQDLGLE